VLRTTLTGTHALLTREIETDVTLLLDEHGFGAARELVDPLDLSAGVAGVAIEEN
jgi:uncharacterized protein